MSVRDELTKALATAKKEHEAASKAYRKALDARSKAEVEVRAACDVASEAANSLAALNTAVAKL